MYTKTTPFTIEREGFQKLRWICRYLILWTFSVLVNHTMAQSLNVVVEATYSDYAVPSSRDAHFNWTFQSSGGGSVRMGQFACGSWWVAPAVGDTGVTVLSLTGNPAWTDYISCDADPITESHGLMGTKHPAPGVDPGPVYGSYDSSENIIPNLPLTFSPTSGSCVSLVAAIQRNESETGNSGTSAIWGEAVDAYCVVTVMPDAPSNNGDDMIRPNITGTYKEFLTWSDFDLSKLPVYSFLNGYTAQGWVDAAARWRHSTEIFSISTETSPNNFENFSEGGRAFRAQILIDDYAMGAAALFHNDFYAILSDDNTLAEKQSALAAMLAYGLDLYHARYDSTNGLARRWESGAGQWFGRFLPVALIATLQIDPTKANQLSKVAITNHGDDPAEFGPQELRQITRGVTGVLLWGDRTPVLRTDNSFLDEDWRYWSDHRNSNCYDTAINACTPSVGKKTSADLYGYIDGPANKPGTNYMSVTAGAARAFAGIMVLVPALTDVINTTDPIEYADRLVRHGLWTYPDPVAPIAVVDQSGCNTWYDTNGCQEWGITWGPYLPDIRFAIEDGVGRFHSLHGASFSMGNGSSQANNNWSSIMALYNGPTYEDNLVPVGTVVAPEILFEKGVNPKVHILCATIDAEVRYTLDGSTPTASSSLYTGPVAISDGTEVKAKGYYPGFTDSAVSAKTYINTGDTNDPSVPTNLAVGTVTTSSVDLSWSASTDDIGIGGYKVYVDGANPVTVSGTSTTVFGLIPSTSYIFTVSAVDTSSNESAQSNGVNATTLSDVTPPSVPGGLIASGATSVSVNLDWDASTDDTEVAGYNVYTNGSNPVSISETMVTVAGLTPQTSYSFSVSAFDTASNESAQSGGVQVMTTAQGTPVILDQSQFSIHWVDSEEVVGEDAPATNAIDGDVNTFWHSKWQGGTDPKPHEIQINLGGMFTVNELRYLPRQDSNLNGTVLNYEVYVSTDGSNWTPVDSGIWANNANEKSSTFTEVAGVTHVSLRDVGTASSWTTATEINVLGYIAAAVPTAPSGLSATTMSASTIDLSWSDNSSDETGFNIERKTGAGSYTQVAQVGANVSSYSDSGLNEETSYTYRVVAYNGAGLSAYSNEDSATTFPVVPLSPTGLSATAVSASGIDLSWSDNSDNETGFNIERKTGAGSYAQIAQVGANVSSYSDSGLAESTSYTYRILAYNGAGSSGYSNEGSATTQSSGGGGTPGILDQSQFSVYWVDSEETVGENAPVTNAIDGDSNTFWHTKWQGGADPKPHEIQIALGGTFTVSELHYLPRQDAYLNGTILSYEVYVSTDGSNWTQVDSGTWANSHAEKISSFSAVSGVTHIALKDIGTSSAWTTAAEINVIGYVGATPPDAPSGLSATAISTSQINLSWTDNADDETGFNIERKTGGGSFSLFTSVGANVTSFSDTGLSSSTSYTYRVLASNTSGDSGYSNESSAMTQSPTPSLLNQSQFSVYWVDSEETVGENAPATNAIDGDGNTFWHSKWQGGADPKPHEIQIALGSTFTVSELHYLPRQDAYLNGTVLSYEIYVSTDGTNWTQVDSGSWANSHDEKISSFSAVSGVTHVALKDVGTGSSWTTVAEINVVGY